MCICACVLAKSLRSCLTLCNPMNCSPPGSSVHGILQARMLELGCHAPLQGIFPTQGSDQCLLHLLHWQVGSLLLMPPGKPRICLYVYSCWGFPGGSVGKGSACQCRRCGFNLWIRKISWRRASQPTPVFLPGESHGQRSLVGYSLVSQRVSHHWSD